MPTEKLDPLLVATLYARDSGQCVFCGQGLAEGIALTIDHLLPRVWGGSYLASNLLTCCRPCHDLKDTADAETFVDLLERHRDGLPELARFGSRTTADIRASVQAATRRPANYAHGRLCLARVRSHRQGD